MLHNFWLRLRFYDLLVVRVRRRRYRFSGVVVPCALQRGWHAYPVASFNGGGAHDSDAVSDDAFC